MLKGGDSLVIFDKWQADQLTRGFRVQAERLAASKRELERLRMNHQSLILDYRDARLEIAETNAYNDSMISMLAQNMALLYKINDTSGVHYIDLRYYEVDVFQKGTIVLRSLDERNRKKLDELLAEYPDWQYINIGWELKNAYKSFAHPFRLYPDRFMPRTYYY